jgi:restriction system protein
MNLWMVRAGKHGEEETICLEKGIVTISWNSLPDLRLFKSREDLQKEYQKHYKEKNIYSEGNKVGQIFRFANAIKKGDLIVLPSKFQPIIFIGKVSGDYTFKKISDTVFHWIPVKWINEVQRAKFDEDLLFSFGSLLTVSKIVRNNAAERVNALMEGKAILETEIADEEGDSIKYADTDTLAYTKLENFIRENFREYALEDLINEILKAHGYTTARTKEIGDIDGKHKKGADGGVDILASKGALGFEAPRICAQVKSGEDELSTTELDKLIGVMKKFNAEYGLLVSWGGFKKTLIQEARNNYFNIRLWNSSNIIQEIFQHYEKFSEDFKNRLPLKRIWVLEEKELE